jgi:hypothetical protein
MSERGVEVEDDEVIQLDDFIARYAAPEGENVAELVMKQPPLDDDEYEEPEPPARTVEELDAQWKANGMPDDERARRIAEVKEAVSSIRHRCGFASPSAPASPTSERCSPSTRPMPSRRCSSPWRKVATRPRRS